MTPEQLQELLYSHNAVCQSAIKKGFSPDWLTEYTEMFMERLLMLLKELKN